MTHTLSHTMPSTQNQSQELALLGVFTDYEHLVAPHVPAIRDVLTGKSYRYKLKYHDATFVFHHGCLMTQVLHQGTLRALPPFGVDANGAPYFRTLPEHQSHWLAEFMTLPKSLLLFYFTLLKETFQGHPLRGQWEDPVTGQVMHAPLPAELRPLLQEVGWLTR